MRNVIRRRRQMMRRNQADGGFTLIEMVVTVAILGIITVALVGVVLAYFKTTTTTESRLGESTDQQFVSTYWQTDVSSLGVRSLNASNVADPVPSSQSVFKSPSGGCGSTIAGGSVVVRLEWKAFNVGDNGAQAWQGTDQAAAYVSVPRGNQFALVRARCDGNEPEDRVTVARTLTAPPVVQCDGSDTCPSNGSLPAKMTMKLVVRNQSDPDSPGYTTILTGDRRQG